MATFTSNSPEETETIGREMARNLEAGSVLALTGDLGSGKTQFTKGLVAGMGCDSNVTSPTFVLVHEYSGGRLTVYHFDFFRLDNEQSVTRLGFDDDSFRDGVAVIEWADRFPESVPPNARWIAFKLKSENARTIETK